MQDSDYNHENEIVNKGGRPRKKSKLSINTGRKRVENEYSSSTLYRRAHEIIDNYEVEAIELALTLIKKDTSCNNIIKNENIKELIIHSDESALAFFIDLDLNKQNYDELVNDTKLRNSSIYPSYFTVCKAMNKCKLALMYDVKSETEVAVSLQSMLNMTSERLCGAVAMNWESSILRRLELMVTVGFDSSSGHTNPHQKYQSSFDENKNAQHSLFVSSMVIIQLKEELSDQNLWVNPIPQSVRLCRPIRIALEKEDEATTLHEFQRLNDEIKALIPHTFIMPNLKKVRVKFNVYQTIFDGKCVNTIVGNSASTRCPICLRTSHQFNNIDDDFKANESSLKYGLGLLHCTIKCFEFLLHISYRKDLETWDVRQNLKGIIIILIIFSYIE